MPLIVGFARAVELCLAELPAESQRLAGLRDQLWSRLARELPDLRRNGHPERRLPGNLNVCFAGVEADAILVGLREVALSTGSACASGSGEPSHVLRALGLPDALARSRGALRDRPREHRRGAGLGGGAADPAGARAARQASATRDAEASLGLQPLSPGPGEPRYPPRQRRSDRFEGARACPRPRARTSPGITAR